MSATYSKRTEDLIGKRLRIAIVSELRKDGALAILRRLWAMRAETGYVLLEESGGTPLLPLLRLLLSLTRCRSLFMVPPVGTPSRFSRWRVLRELVDVAFGSLRGILAALVCWIELTRYRVQPSRPRKPLTRNIHRIAYLKTNLWFGVRTGGSVAHVAGVVNALIRRGIGVDVLAVERPPLLGEEVACHVMSGAPAFGHPYELNYYAFQRRFVKEAATILCKQSPAFLYHRLSLANYTGAALARRLGVSLVVEYNGSEVWVARHWGRPLRFSRLAQLAEDIGLREADLIVTVSDVLCDELVERGFPVERVISHPNGVDAEQFDPTRFSTQARETLRARYGIGAADIVCGFIGTFGMWHGVPVLAEAIRRLVEVDEQWVRDRGVRFMLVGDGVLMPRVREILAAPGVASYVTLTGLVPQHEAPLYLSAADVLLSPHVPNPDGSRFFGSPTKLFEYMAMSKPIVASDLNQIGEVLRPSFRVSQLPTGPCRPEEDRLAVLATPGNVEELIAGIRFLVEHPDYRATLGRNARQEVLRRYTWDHNVQALFDRLQALGEGKQCTSSS